MESQHRLDLIAIAESHTKHLQNAMDRLGWRYWHEALDGALEQLDADRTETLLSLTERGPRYGEPWGEEPNGASPGHSRRVEGTE